MGIVPSSIAGNLINSPPTESDPWRLITQTPPAALHARTSTTSGSSHILITKDYNNFTKDLVLGIRWD
ncbi:hypothetical protein CEXT_125651 [Caerostris extrusa]|uniref:Uncharacterized protein n=1 Tax=Caerostris extrusa TaxID=172846 RepID=A0AAV4QYE9_CAEEX|nr:hypothetical protein CEXT_125651 [Caerostris extrusa]